MTLGLRAKRWRAPALAGAAIVIVLLGIVQIVLPAIAADRLRDRLSPHGQVQEVSVSAVPAIELLWNQADSVTVRMSSYTDTVPSSGSSGNSGKAATPATPATTPTERLANLLAGTSRTGTLHASVGVLHSGGLVLDNVVLTKQGGQLQASALLTRSNLDAALPSAFTLSPLSTGAPAGQLEFRGTAHVLGATLSVTAVLRAQSGALVVTPDIGGFVPSFLSLTVLSDPRISVDSVGARQVKGGWVMSASAHLTG